jgi:hypothetical protein
VLALLSLGLPSSFAGAVGGDPFQVLDGGAVGAVAFGNDGAHGAQPKAGFLCNLAQRLARLVHLAH